eukprot:TRINITY_DN2714_c0_g1_i1.p1 TRINITY_DN2714_c0_g1~~TRINITY_DN2714_c0_g1_i1.p1  ORF type:complete len:563 (+),score=69.89 TRINITY_DN2714_c0_g1_i1:29-1690(+)
MESTSDSEPARGLRSQTSETLESSDSRSSQANNGSGTGAAVRLSKEILNAFRNSHLHFVLLANARSNLYTCVSSDRTPPPRPLDVASDVDAVVVGCFLGFEMPSMKLVRVAVDRRVHQLVLVLVLALPEDHIDQSVVGAVRKAFTDLGASNVFLVKSAVEAKACVTSFLMRDDKSDLPHREEQRVIQRDSQYVPRSRSLEKHVEVVSWANIHKSVRSVPQLDPDVDPQIQQGERICDGILVQRLGQGACGEVYLWRHFDGQTEAFKFIQKGPTPQGQQVLSICREVKLLSRLRHSNVVSLCRIIHAQHHVIISTNFAGKMNLFRFLQCAPLHKKSCPESRSSLYGPINDGVAYCHEQGVAHRDLKPENVVVSHSDETSSGKLTLTIVDFDSACRIGDYRSDLVGTMPFIAPDAMMGEKYCPARADMWSCGVIFLEIVYGVGKFSKMLKIKQTLKPSRDFGRYVMKFFNALHHRYYCKSGSLPAGMLSVLFSLLEPDPEKRWAAQDVEASDWYALTQSSSGTRWIDEQNEAALVREDVRLVSFDSADADLEGLE